MCSKKQNGTYRRNLDLLYKCYRSFSMVNDKLHSIRTCLCINTKHLSNFKFLNSTNYKTKLIEIKRERHKNTNQECHIMAHMLLHSCYKPGNTEFESSHLSTNAIIRKANHIDIISYYNMFNILNSCLISF